MIDKKRLWEAYLAGFDESGEGFNGEYVGPKYRTPEALETRLRPYFEGWLEGKTSDQVWRELEERGENG